MTYAMKWVNDQIFQPNYSFYSTNEFNYHIPDALEHSKILEYIEKIPANDSPNVFGLHANADLTFRKNKSIAMINTLLDTQPKDSGGGSGKSREEEVKDNV